MKVYYEVKVRFEKTMENGMVRKVKEPYLFEALSFTEAEGMAIEELTPFMPGSFEVTDIKRAVYADLFPSDKKDADKWYAVRINFLTADEFTGAVRKTRAEYLVQASDIYSAKDDFNEVMRKTLMDYEVVAMKETPIMDVYSYTGKGGRQ